MIKKDLIFLEKYEKREGRVLIENDWIYIQTENNQEAHKIETTGINVCFNLSSLFLAWKSLHGARNCFSIEEKGINVFIKKDNSFEKEILVETDKPFKPIKETGKHIGTIQSESLYYLDMYKNLSTKLRYIDFLENPTVIITPDEAYIWGTDCIHKLRINFHTIHTPNYSFQIPVNIMKDLSEFGELLTGELNVQINDSNIGFFNDDNSFILPILNVENICDCEWIKNSEHQLTSDDLLAINSIKWKNIIAEAKKEKKESYEITISIKEGQIFLNNKLITQLSIPISTSKPIHAYRFMRFISDIKSLYVSKNYLRNGDAILIL